MFPTPLLTSAQGLQHGPPPAKATVALALGVGNVLGRFWAGRLRSRREVANPTGNQGALEEGFAGEAGLTLCPQWESAEGAKGKCQHGLKLVLSTALLASSIGRTSCKKGRHKTNQRVAEFFADPHSSLQAIRQQGKIPLFSDCCFPWLPIYGVQGSTGTYSSTAVRTENDFWAD